LQNLIWSRVRLPVRYGARGGPRFRPLMALFRRDGLSV